MLTHPHSHSSDNALPQKSSGTNYSSARLANQPSVLTLSYWRVERTKSDLFTGKNNPAWVLDVCIEDTFIITSKAKKGLKGGNSVSSRCLCLSGNGPRCMIDTSKNTSSLQSQQCQAYLLQCHLSSVMISHLPQYHQTTCEWLLSQKKRMYL